MVPAWLLEGKRAEYANPIKFAFLASTLYVVVNQLSNTATSRRFSIHCSRTARSGPTSHCCCSRWRRAAAPFPAFNTAESYAFGLFVFGELALLGTALLALDRLTGLGAPPRLYQVGAALYTTWAVTGLHADRRWSVWPRGVLIFAFELAALAALLYGVQRYRFSRLGA